MRLSKHKKSQRNGKKTVRKLKGGSKRRSTMRGGGDPKLKLSPGKLKVLKDVRKTVKAAKVKTMGISRFFPQFLRSNKTQKKALQFTEIETKIKALEEALNMTPETKQRHSDILMEIENNIETIQKNTDYGSKISDANTLLERLGPTLYVVTSHLNTPIRTLKEYGFSQNNIETYNLDSLTNLINSAYVYKDNLRKRVAQINTSLDTIIKSPPPIPPRRGAMGSRRAPSGNPSSPRPLQLVHGKTGVKTRDNPNNLGTRREIIVSGATSNMAFPKVSPKASKKYKDPAPAPLPPTDAEPTHQSWAEIQAQIATQSSTGATVPPPPLPPRRPAPAPPNEQSHGAPPALPQPRRPAPQPPTQPTPVTKSDPQKDTFVSREEMKHLIDAQKAQATQPSQPQQLQQEPQVNAERYPSGTIVYESPAGPAKASVATVGSSSNPVYAAVRKQRKKDPSPLPPPVPQRANLTRPQNSNQYPGFGESETNTISIETLYKKILSDIPFANSTTKPELESQINAFKTAIMGVNNQGLKQQYLNAINNWRGMLMNIQAVENNFNNNDEENIVLSANEEANAVPSPQTILYFNSKGQPTQAGREQLRLMRNANANRSNRLLEIVLRGAKESLNRDKELKSRGRAAIGRSAQETIIEDD